MKTFKEDLSGSNINIFSKSDINRINYDDELNNIDITSTNITNYAAYNCDINYNLCLTANENYNTDNNTSFLESDNYFSM
jgi:hypothetical protein